MKMSSLRFCTTSVLMALNIGLLLIGGLSLWAGFLTVMLLKTALDELIGDAKVDEGAAPARLLDILAMAALPLLLVNSILFAHYFSSAEHTWLGGMLARIGIDFDATRHATTAFHLIGATMSMGALYGLGLNTTHELIHRTTDPVATIVARWLGALSCESGFTLHHMAVHHVNAGLYEEPGTSRRGESVYAFIWRATIGANRQGFILERERLRRRGLPLWSWHNRFLTGQAMTVAIAVLYFLCGGWPAVGAFLVVSFQGHFFLEAAGYVEHFGLVRAPGTRFEARHAWNSYRAVSNAILYNLAYHAHHHLYASRPYYELRRDEGAPVLPHGYMTMFALSLLPPLYFRVMQPHLDNWDCNYATDAELRYLRAHGKRVWEPAPVPAE
jgi:hypothetical protein